MARDCTLTFHKPGSSNLCIGSESMTPEFVPEMARWFKAAGVDMVAHFRLTDEKVMIPADQLRAIGVMGLFGDEEIPGTFSDEFIVDIDGRREIQGRRAGDF